MSRSAVAGLHEDERRQQKEHGALTTAAIAIRRTASPAPRGSARRRPRQRDREKDRVVVRRERRPGNRRRRQERSFRLKAETTRRGPVVFRL